MAGVRYTGDDVAHVAPIKGGEQVLMVLHEGIVLRMGTQSGKVYAAFDLPTLEEVARLIQKSRTRRGETR